MNTKEKLYDILRNYMPDSNVAIKENSRLVSDLGLVSMDLFGVVCDIEDMTGLHIPDAELAKYITVGDILDDILKRQEAAK